MAEPATVPETVGSYRVLGMIGTGGMGAVYRGEHSLLGRGAAIKVLRPEHSENHETVNRFFNEAKAAAAIKHPGIVEVYDFGYLPSGAAYLVLELLEGQTLRSRLRARGRLTEGEAFTIVRGLASALAAAHAKGIVHRDIKPDNIYLVPDPEQPSRERVKLLDFGVAKLSADLGREGGDTQTGVVLGTPSFMAPEQCRGAGKVDHRADLYSVGCVLVQLLTGQGPFPGMGPLETLGAHCFTAPPTLRSRVPEASDRAEEIVARLLAKNPDDRIQTATELVELLADAGASSSMIVSGSTWVPVARPAPRPQAVAPPPVLQPPSAVTGAAQAPAGTAAPLWPVADDLPVTTVGGASLATATNPHPPRPGRRRWALAAGGAVLGSGLVVLLSVLGGGGGPATTPAVPSPPEPASAESPPGTSQGGSAAPAPLATADLDAGVVAPVDAAAAEIVFDSDEVAPAPTRDAKPVSAGPATSSTTPAVRRVLRKRGNLFK